MNSQKHARSASLSNKPETETVTQESSSILDTCKPCEHKAGNFVTPNSPRDDITRDRAPAINWNCTTVLGQDEITFTELDFEILKDSLVW